MITREEVEKTCAALSDWMNCTPYLLGRAITMLRALLARAERAEADRDALRGILDRPAAKDIASVIAERDAAVADRDALRPLSIHCERLAAERDAARAEAARLRKAQATPTATECGKCDDPGSLGCRCAWASHGAYRAALAATEERDE